MLAELWAARHHRAGGAEVRPSIDLRRIRDIDWKQMATRFALGAVVSVVAGVISNSVGARFGGVFLAFPAILPASLTFVEDEQGSRSADRSAIGAVLGGLSLVVFAAVGEAMFTRHPPLLVLVAALGAWLAACLALYAALAALRPDDCDARKDRSASAT